MSATPSDPPSAPSKRSKAKHQPRNKDKSEVFATSGRDQTSIGPGLYPTGDPPLVDKVEILFDLITAMDHVQDIIVELTSSTHFVKLLSRQAHSPAERDAFLQGYSRSIFAATIVAFTQNLCHSHHEVHGVLGDVSSVVNINQMLPNVLRKYALQYGEFANEHLKQAFIIRPQDYIDVVRRHINVAAAALRGADLGQLATQYLSPTHDNDRSLDLMLRLGYETIIKSHPLAINIRGYDMAPFANAADPFADALHAAQAFAGADRAAIDFFRGNRPANHAGFANNAYWRLVAAATGYAYANLGNGQPQFGALGEYKTAVGAIAADYSVYEPLTAECFVVLGSEQTKGVSGSPMQACSRSIMGDIIVVHQPCPMTPTEVAFAAILPMEFRTRQPLPRTRHNATTTDVAKVRREFVARAFKS